MTDTTLPATDTADPRIRRLLRDLTALGLMETGNDLDAAERLNAALGPELHQAIRAELDRTLPMSNRFRRVA